MQDLRSTTCTCRQAMFESGDRCFVCAQSRQKRMSQHSYVLPERAAKRPTPPPSQPASPRASYDAAAHSLPARNYSASDVFTNAMSSDSGGNSLFPPSLYRHSVRSAGEARRTSETSSIRSTSSNTTSSQDTSRKPSRSATPDSRALESGYAPIAAGFARLSLKSEYSSSSSDSTFRERAPSIRPSLDLEARMFSGPA